jgi:hypothetical protein
LSVAYQAVAAENERLRFILRARMAAESFSATGIISFAESKDWYLGFDRLRHIRLLPSMYEISFDTGLERAPEILR